MINKVIHPKDIPNVAGFKFLALVRGTDGDSFCPAQVLKNDLTGCYYVSGVEYKKIIGWLNADKNGNPIYLQ